MGDEVVVKVGGSLLDWPELPSRLTEYLERRRADRLVLIVGGGPFADNVRDLDARHALGEARSHALAIRVLDLTAHVLGSLLPDSVVVGSVEDLPGVRSRGQIPILAPSRFLEADDRSPDHLPHAWTTTTDSIAARLADRLGARELVLLKSASLPPGADWREAARLGLVDPEFPKAAKDVPLVTFHNFRASARSPIKM